ncbi:hypothetical protein H2201_005221 [Coniosporium apollinis]|uniref:Uncharacterized protein n=1 Tax=Coniosporium apollinis TaxID=61459 RepID=A0ABQ9NQN4_9PEZI|nr:hypothetical protein H2201_005221 [Coniosporium apollinis]
MQSSFSTVPVKAINHAIINNLKKVPMVGSDMVHNGSLLAGYLNTKGTEELRAYLTESETYIHVLESFGVEQTDGFGLMTATSHSL